MPETSDQQDQDDVSEVSEVEYMPAGPDVPVIYANSTQLRLSIHDMQFLLGQADPTDANHVQVKPIARVVMSPQHAKALATVLNRHLEIYEKNFGPIPTEQKEGASTGEASPEAGRENGA